MKKKLLPYILGFAMVAATPFVAHADTLYHIGTDIDNKTSTTIPDKSSTIKDSGKVDDQYTDFLKNAHGPDSHNEFTEYNDTSTTNTVAKVFGSGDGAIGNSRNTDSSMQTLYPVAIKNEAKQETTLAGDIADSNFGETTNDCFGDTSSQSTPALTDHGYTDLETAISEFTMTIPAKTVLPIGATYWRIGNVKINGQYFVRPDKIKVVATHQNFRHSTFDSEDNEQNQTNKVIQFTVADKQYDDTSIEGVSKYFFQNGAGHQQSSFPYAYTQYTSTDYEGGMVSDINETHQVWLKIASAQWQNKTSGKYTGTITFTASVVTDDTTAIINNKYPGEGTETDPNSAITPGG